MIDNDQVIQSSPTAHPPNQKVAHTRTKEVHHTFAYPKFLGIGKDRPEQTVQTRSDCS